MDKGCIVGWVEDESVEGEHRAVPTFCSDYARELEILVLEMADRSGQNTDRIRLSNLRKTYGISGELPEVYPIGIENGELRVGIAAGPACPSCYSPFCVEHGSMGRILGPEPHV